MSINALNSGVNFDSYWRGLSRRQKEALAASVESSVGYLRQVFLYERKPGAKMANELSKHTPFSCSHFRPDIFGEPPGEEAAA